MADSPEVKTDVKVEDKSLNVAKPAFKATKVPAEAKKVEKVERKAKALPGALKLTPSTSPTTRVSDVVTVVTNISSNRIPFGFLPPHGKELAAGASVTIDGDLMAQLQTGGGRTHKRKLQGLKDAIDAQILRYYVNHRQIVYGAVDLNQTIVAGDLVWLNTDDIRAASQFTWDTNIATTQAAFANVFLGVALEGHTGAAVTDFPVDISPLSVYAFTADSEAHELSVTLGPAKDTGNALLSNKLDNAVAASSVARVARRDASATATALVRIQSAYWGINSAGSM